MHSFKLFVLVGLLGMVVAQISFSRTVNSISGMDFNLMISPGCKNEDKYGSNDCTLEWGQTVNITANGTLDQDLEEGATFLLAAKIDNIVPFKVSCPVCGANCSFEIPVIGTKVNLPMPPCPIKAATFFKKLSEVMPKKNPLGLKVGLTAAISIGSLLSIEITASLA